MRRLEGMRRMENGERDRELNRRESVDADTKEMGKI